MQYLQREVDADIVRLTLDRPESLNAFDDDLTADFETALDDIEAGGARCVVLTGAGNAFCAGGDIDRMKARRNRDVRPHEYASELRTTSQPLVRRLFELDCPTIAAVNGVAVGLGLGLALACDVTIAVNSARFGASFRNVGLGPDSGVSSLLPRLVGPKIALELLYTGRLISASEAAELGLVNDVVDEGGLEEAVTELATTIATGPTVALTAAKRLVRESQQTTLPGMLDAEADAQGLLLSTTDHEEGLTAFLEGRDPEFEGR